MKNYFFLFLFCAFSFSSKAQDIASCCTSEEARCTGSSNCRACTNCSRCAHCNSGGSCEAKLFLKLQFESRENDLGLWKE